MRYALTYLEMLTTSYESYDDCRKALLFHRFYISIEESLEKYIDSKTLRSDNLKSYHKNVVEAAKQYFGLSENIVLVFDELRRFRHLFVRNHTISRFDNHKLDGIFCLIVRNLQELQYVLEEISQ